MKIAVAMSGGVDSSIAAYLLKNQGYDVVGFTLELINKKSDTHVQDAKKTAELIGIEHRVIDIKERFKKTILKYFVDEYLKGRTPNPCIVCNRTIKFGGFLLDILKNKAEYMATGHYAIIEKENKRFTLKKGLDPAKDQSYFLSTLSQEQLARIILPLGKLNKTETSELAAELGFPAVDRDESQDVCFIEDGHYSDLVHELSGLYIEPGDIEYIDGEKLGRHNGIINYTIGQRRGLGISWSEPLYVVRILPEENKIIVGENKHLFTRQFFVPEFFWILEEFKHEKKFMGDVKIRYLNKPSLALIMVQDDGSVMIEFNEPVRAITPGQHAAVYKDDLVIGGGSIATK